MEDWHDLREELKNSYRKASTKNYFLEKKKEKLEFKKDRLKLQIEVLDQKIDEAKRTLKKLTIDRSEEEKKGDMDVKFRQHITRGRRLKDEKIQGYKQEEIDVYILNN